MKKRMSLLLVLVATYVVGLTGCSSEAIQGTWYAVNNQGLEITIQITEEEISFHAEGVEDITAAYKVSGSGFVNSTTYKIVEFDGETYSFVFPDKKDEKNALILLPKDKDDATVGTVVWVLSRENFPDKSAFYK